MVEDNKNIEPVIVESDYGLERGKPVPSLVHGRLQSKIIIAVERHSKGKLITFGELSLKAQPQTLIPDVAIYPHFEVVPEEDKIKMDIAPLGVVEILSPTQNISELLSKRQNYIELGVQSYWLVIPQLRSIYVFDEKGEYEIFVKKQLLKDQQLNIEISLAEIF